MNECLIENWNNKVAPDDTVIHAGDFCFGDPSKYIHRLNGNITLVIGNHDNNTLRYLKQNPISRIRVCSSAMVISHEQKVLIYHYPLWQKRYSNAEINFPGNYDILLYGHVHNGNESFQGPWNTKNISLEVMNYEPQELEVVVDTILKNRV